MRGGSRPSGSSGGGGGGRASLTRRRDKGLGEQIEFNIITHHKARRCSGHLAATEPPRLRRRAQREGTRGAAGRDSRQAFIFTLAREV